MLSILTPAITGMTASLPAANATEQLLRRQVEARQTAVAPEIAMSGTALSTIVEAAVEADPAYGIVSALTSQEVTDAYTQTARLLTLFYANPNGSIAQFDAKI